MKNSLIALALLFFVIPSDAHSSPDAVATDAKDVYQVLEDPDSITFVSPQSDRDILRDIVYYHLVESAYGDEDPSVTERSFTNGHGLGLPNLEGTTLNNNGYSRRKRDADMQKIPEAPSIPKIQYNSFPPYLRRLISTGRPDYIDNYGQTANQPKIQSRLGDVPITMRSEPERPEARTYGMRLTPEATYVWNDLLNTQEDFQSNDRETNKKDIKNEFIAPRIDIRHDNTDITNKHKEEEEEIKYNKQREIEKVIQDRMKEILATAKPVYFKEGDSSEEEKEVNEKDEMLTEETDEKPTEEANDEEAFMEEELPRTYGMRLLNGRGYVWNDIFTNPGLSFDVGEPKDPNEMDMTREPTLELPGRPIDLFTDDGKPEMVPSTNEDVDSDEGEENKEDLDDIFVQIAKHKQTTPSPTIDVRSQRNEEKDPDELAGELMQNEQFWNWVTQWTQMIMDIMRKYTKKAAEAEVKKQFRVNLKEVYQLHSKNKHESENIPLNAQKDEIELTKHNDEESERNEKSNSNNFIIIKDDKLIVDGIEILLTHHSNLVTEKSTSRKEKGIDTQLKRRKKKPSLDRNQSVEKRNKTEVNDSEKLNKKNNNEYKVKIENVYGNAVNSDKVTNIFVFHPDKGTHEIVEELKPILGENGVFIIQPDHDKNKDEQDPMEPNKEDSTEKAPTDASKEEEHNKEDIVASKEEEHNRGDTTDSDKSPEKPDGKEKETVTDTDKTGEANGEEESPGENRDPAESNNAELDKSPAINQENDEKEDSNT